MQRFIFLFIILFVELYFLQAIKTFSQDFSPSKRHWILWVSYVLAAFSIGLGLLSLFYAPGKWNAFVRFTFSIGFLLLICKLFGISFMIIDDVLRVFRWMVSRFQSQVAETGATPGGISRLKFLSQLAVTFTVVPAVGFLYGMVRGAYKYRIHNVKVPSPNLPDAFDGFKIVQLSDIHVGSFINPSPLNRAFDIVMGQNADLILFTGDLVNNVADELKGYESTFSRLKAPHGVYSVLGNHDYGDYVDWDSDHDKLANLNRLKELQASFGWKLLMNEHLPIEKNGQHIGLIGIENWGGRAGFHRYGKLDQAYRGAENYPFKILMSHDPSHWDLQVRPDYNQIDLTLSGHTHGMQMGVEIGHLKWSPAKWIYKEWAGLYREGAQFLYVNRGLGFLGYPGRLGIWPEITVIELQKV